MREATIPEVALNWLLGTNDRVIPTVGAKNLPQTQGNAGTLRWQLSPDELNLTACSKPRLASTHSAREGTVTRDASSIIEQSDKHIARG